MPFSTRVWLEQDRDTSTLTYYAHHLGTYIIMVITSYKDSIVAILHIQNSIILIQTTEYKIQS